MRFPALLLFISLSSALFCQTKKAPPIQFGLIPKEDLTMTVYEQDTSAEAVVLCDFETVDISIGEEVLVRKARHRRIKILHKKGFDYGDVAIPFYSYQKKEQFFFDQATIHFPNGNFEQLNKKDIFIEEINEYWSKAKFTFPKMAEGCVIEYAYYLNSTNYYEPEDWFFQEKIPVRHSELRMGIPERLGYNYFFQGNEGMEKVREEKDLTVLHGRNGTCTIQPFVFIFENAPAMKEESYITSMSDYLARIRFQLSDIRHYDGRLEKVTNTWENLRKELETSEYFGHHYLKKGYYKDITEELSPILAGLPTQQEKAAFAYDFITKKVSWNGHHSIYGGAEKIKELFEKGSGNSAQVNLMLLVLLREAGLAAGPVLTSTRSHGKMYEDYPILDQFDHLLILAEIDGEPVFLDATEPLRPMGYPDVAALNSRGWHLENGWIDINAPSESVDAYFSELTLSEDGTFAGKMIGMYRGYNAIPERRHYLESPDGKHWTRRLNEKFAEVEVASATATNVSVPDPTFTDTVHFTINQAAQAVGDFIYFSPIIYAGFSENPFKLEDRNYPIDFPYSIREQHNIKIHLPEGYTLDEAPESLRVVLPNKGGMFLYAVNDKQPGLLTFNISLSIKQLKFYPEQYAGVKELFSLFIEKLGEQIVLKKTG